MIRTVLKSMLVACIVYSGSAVAAIVPISLTNVLGPVVYLGGAEPTPLQPGGSAEQDQFSLGQELFVAAMLDLTQLNRGDDETYGDPDTFLWEILWVNSLDPTADAVDADIYDVKWSYIEDKIALGEDELVLVSPLSYVPATAGDWVAYTYFEFNTDGGSTQSFSVVPVPSTLFLLGLGLVGVVARKKRVAA